VDWERVEGFVSREAARLAEGDKAQQERADALEACLRQGEQARQAREVAEGLRLGRERLAAAILEAAGVGCRCDGKRVCCIHVLAKKALDGDGAVLSKSG
jgi:hypothetical protein